MNIVLVAINAKYIHSNLAVYSLKAYAEKYAKNENIEIEIRQRTKYLEIYMKERLIF